MQNKLRKCLVRINNLEIQEVNSLYNVKYKPILDTAHEEVEI